MVHPRRADDDLASALRLSQRRIIKYSATCRDCDETLESPNASTVHATSESHVVEETKVYLIEGHE